jgi:hypothetical protein
MAQLPLQCLTMGHSWNYNSTLAIRTCRNCGKKQVPNSNNEWDITSNIRQVKYKPL